MQEQRPGECSKHASLRKELLRADRGLPQNTWTYNQGVVLSGLGQLYQITGDSTYITEAQTTIDAVDAHLTSGGVIKDTCDNSSGSSQCTGDGVRLSPWIDMDED